MLQFFISPQVVPPEEDSTAILTLPLLNTVTYPQAHTYDETGSSLLNFPREQEDGYNPLIETTPWLPLPFIYDEIGSTLLNFDLEQEDAWIAQTEVIVWPVIISVYDEIGSNLLNFYLEQEEPYTPLTESIIWPVGVSTDDEISTGLANFYLEDANPPTLTTSPYPLPSAIPATDDEVTHPNVLDDDYTTQQPPYTFIPLPPSVLTDDESFPVGIIDDDYNILTPSYTFTLTAALLPNPTDEDIASRGILDEDGFIGVFAGCGLYYSLQEPIAFTFRIDDGEKPTSFVTVRGPLIGPGKFSRKHRNRKKDIDVALALLLLEEDR